NGIYIFFRCFSEFHSYSPHFLLSYIFASSSSLNYFLLTAIAYDSDTVFIVYLRLLIGITLHYPANFLFFILDRKSTRLNSSHVSISYAVFCFKREKHNL